MIVSPKIAKFIKYANGSGYQCVLPGNVLIEAQRKPVRVALEDGGTVDLAATRWYDPIAGDDDYLDIKRMIFDGQKRYMVRYINRHVRVKYMFAEAVE
jgi:hypothetical protein